MVGVIPEAKLNLAIYHLKNGIVLFSPEQVDAACIKQFMVCARLEIGPQNNHNMRNIKYKIKRVPGVFLSIS